MSSLTLNKGVGSRGGKEVVQRSSATGVDSVFVGATMELRKFVLANATYTNATKVINEAGAFTNYTFAAGDVVRLWFTDGVMEDVVIASKTDANNIVLQDNVNGGVDTTGVKNIYIGEDVKYVEARVVQDGTSTVVSAWKRLFSQFSNLYSFYGFFTDNDTTDSIPIGGHYNWQFRVIGSRGNVINTFNDLTKWGVGYLFLLSGQSNEEWLHKKFSAPVAAHAMVSMFASSYRAASVNTSNQWADLTANPEGDGIHDMLNELRTRYNTQHGFDVPIGVVAAAVGGSSLLPNYKLASGYWLDAQNNPGEPFQSALTMLQTATDKVFVEAVSWQQGENEASAIVSIFKHIFPGAYKSGLNALKRQFEAHISGPNGKVDIVWAATANLFSLITYSGDNANTNGPSAPITQREIVLEDFQSFVKEQGQRSVPVCDIPLEQDDTVVTEAILDYGLHWSIPGLKKYGTRLAKTLYSVNGTTKLAKSGPTILSARIGTKADMANRNTIFVECQLDTENGSTTLVLGDTGSIHIWEAWDQKGPLAVTSVTLKDSRFFELTVERDLIPAGAHPTLGYDKPNGGDQIVGNHVIVRYGALATFQQVATAGTSEFLIIDDGADEVLPLVPSFGFCVDRPTARQVANFDIKIWGPGIAHTPLRDISAYSVDWILADISALNLAGLTITLVDYTTWDKAAGSTSINWPQPGDRIVFEDIISGVYVHEAIVRRVTGIVANEPTIEVTHDMSANSNVFPYDYIPTINHRARIFRPRTPCGIVAKSAVNADSFGARPAILNSEEAKYV